MIHNMLVVDNQYYNNWTYFPLICLYMCDTCYMYACLFIVSDIIMIVFIIAMPFLVFLYTDNNIVYVFSYSKYYTFSYETYEVFSLPVAGSPPYCVKVYGLLVNH